MIAEFPKLAETAYQLTSERTDKYNCIAWAAGDDGYWWWPGRFWPKGVPAAVTKVAFSKAFAERGYVECDVPDLEEGFEKVCLYTKLGRPTHAARQLPDGSWTSKLGKNVDISHELEGLRGNKYGQPALYMRRPRSAELEAQAPSDDESIAGT
ncbi:MAG: hypothetical protein ABI422_02125 [Sphingomicrobium sp.]